MASVNIFEYSDDGGARKEYEFDQGTRGILNFLHENRPWK
ncbi:hypothetical protein ARTSIC4J27_2484 [Pseudarthrobacter siccitolerans]|uniref:Uncharacterized protein n=1 Tax=Pseudarthrobacter siccitolerans TaxID=861266 RepID=A0A024H476_9MICC|nr:hypothetical protein ARTSIC4J27_2484 [Pseudarthrobacter siccitolerans]